MRNVATMPSRQREIAETCARIDEQVFDRERLHSFGADATMRASEAVVHYLYSIRDRLDPREAEMWEFTDNLLVMYGLEE